MYQVVSLKYLPHDKIYNILPGKDKTDSGRMCYVSRTETAVMICVVDITNCNRGAEGNALDAFSCSIGKVKENGV